MTSRPYNTPLFVRRARRLGFLLSALPWVATFALIALYAIVERLTGAMGY